DGDDPHPGNHSIVPSWDQVSYLVFQPALDFPPQLWLRCPVHLGLVAYVQFRVRAWFAATFPAFPRTAGATGHRRDAACPGADDQRVRVLPPARLPRMGR